jgi:hypothetical protein
VYSFISEGDFSANVAREIFKPEVENDSLHDINENGLRVLQFATSKHLIVPTSQRS